MDRLEFSPVGRPLNIIIGDGLIPIRNALKANARHNPAGTSRLRRLSLELIRAGKVGRLTGIGDRGRSAGLSSAEVTPQLAASRLVLRSNCGRLG
jgi:hypothetical protein